MLGILFLVSFILALREVVVAKLVILGISLLITFILALRVVLVVISGILFSIFFILGLYTPFLTVLYFTTSFSLLKSTGTGINLSASNILSLLNQPFLPSFDVSIPATFFKSTFVA